MARYLAKANLSLTQGQLLYDHEYDLVPTAEVLGCVDAGFLLPQQPDGTFALPAGPVRRCCGG